MKRSELQKIIREEVSRVLRENNQNSFKIGDTIIPDTWNPSHPMVKRYKSILTSPHKIVHFMDKNDNIVKQMPAEGLIVLSGGAGMGSKFLKTLPIEALKETYYNPEWKLTTVQSWLDGYAKKNNIPFKLIHKTDKNSTVGRHAKTNTYYVYDIGDKYGIVVRNEKVPGAPRLDQLYVIAGPKGSTLGSLVGASTLTDGSEQELAKFLDKVLGTVKEGQKLNEEGTVIWSALQMAKIFRLMKSKGYNPKVHEGNIFNIKTIEIGVPGAGMMKIARDGNIFADYNIGGDATTETELLKQIDLMAKELKQYN